MNCDRCEKEIDEGDLIEVQGGDMVCPDCVSDEFFKCYECEQWCENNDRNETWNGEHICDCCCDDYYSCDDCGGQFGLSEDGCYHDDCEEEYLCPSCSNGASSEPKNSDKYQSRTYGKIIKSKRTFGVELELLTNDNLRGEIDSNFGIKGDASLDTEGTDYEETIEIVSPILKGKKGEDALIEVCDKLRKSDVGVNKSCGLHVHLGAKDFLGLETKVIDIKDVKKFKEEDEFNLYTAFYIPSDVFAKLVAKYDTSDSGRIIAHITQNDFNGCKFVDCEDGFYYADKRIKDRIDNSVVIMKVLEDNFEKLKNLLKFYLIFEPVIMVSQPKSRRESNSYSAPINNSFNFNDLEQVKNYQQLDEYWYKTSDRDNIRYRKSDKYSSARYFSFNFHALLCGTNGGNAGFNTLEIRLHSGTKNAKKILHWTAFHQAILDRIAQGKITSEHLDRASGLFSTVDKMNCMFKLLDLEEDTANAMKKRIEKFGLSTIPSKEDNENVVECVEL